MQTSNPNQSQNRNPNRRKKNDPRYVREIVGYRLVPMQAHHVDEIDAAEGRTDSRKAWWNALSNRPRCRKCFGRLPEGRSTHFCRWNVKNEGSRDSAREMLKVPVYRWVLREGGGR